MRCPNRPEINPHLQFVETLLHDSKRDPPKLLKENPAHTIFFTALNDVQVCSQMNGPASTAPRRNRNRRAAITICARRAPHRVSETCLVPSPAPMWQSPVTHTTPLPCDTTALRQPRPPALAITAATTCPPPLPPPYAPHPPLQILEANFLEDLKIACASVPRSDASEADGEEEAAAGETGSEGTGAAETGPDATEPGPDPDLDSLAKVTDVLDRNASLFRVYGQALGKYDIVMANIVEAKEGKAFSDFLESAKVCVREVKGRRRRRRGGRCTEARKEDGPTCKCALLTSTDPHSNP